MNVFTASLLANSGGGIITPPPSGSGLARYANARIVCLGNSLTRGFGSSAPPLTAYPKQLELLFAALGITVEVINSGVDSAVDSALNSYALTTVDPYYDPSKLCILIYQEVGNTLYFGYADPQGAVDSAKFTLNARNPGWHKIWLGLEDRGVPNGLAGGVTIGGQNETLYRADLATARTLIAAQYTDAADDYIPLQLDPALDDCGDLAYFNSDRTHEIDPGYLAKAQAILNYLDTMALP